MYIRSLEVRNFRAITQLALRDLRGTVVIAGPNGCGKSCVFDAIRLLKSVYGGYQPNEWQNWFGEFQLNANQGHSDWITLFQDRSKPLEIAAEFILSSEEQQYLLTNCRELLTYQVWKEVAPELAGWRYVGATPLASHLRAHQPDVEEQVGQALGPLTDALREPSHQAKLLIHPDGSTETHQSRVLELTFSQYDPQHIGIIDYHGANRNYNREQVAGVNLNVAASEERLRQHALYNYSNKYANLKTEMASSYIRHLLSRQADSGVPNDENLGDTLKELFSTFFPGKEFVGPRATSDGKLQFPVRISNGAEHDIDELSSGEKEVLYGYLRLRNEAPRHSVILIDEPELHLNPRLVSGLALFYHRHLGRSLDNQLWLVTHSDTLIREAVGQDGFSVFHMQPPAALGNANQVAPVEVAQDLERLVVELVGDLAAYRPGAKIVVFEGGGDSQFDVRMTSTLFPHFQTAINAISGGDKRRVADLYDLLERARLAGHLPAKFYSITDRDANADVPRTAATGYVWDAYHIENYLLEPRFILKVLQELNAVTPANATESEVLASLVTCARQTVPALVAHELRTRANRVLVGCVDLGFNPNRVDIARALSEAVARSQSRITEALSHSLSEESLRETESELNRKLNNDLGTGDWMKSFRGRDVLKRFVGSYGNGVRYEAFRDLVLARMRDADYKPAGMAAVIDAILTDPW